MAAADTGRPVAPAAGGKSPARGRGRATGRETTTGAAPGKAPGGLRRSFSTHWYAWTMVAPVVVVIGVIIGYPLVRGVYLSLTNANERNVERSIGVNELPATYEFVGLDNYRDALTGDQFLATLGWTVLWTVACVSITFGLGLALANILNRKIAGRSFYRMLLVLPWAVPGFVSVFAWRFLYNEDSGLFNKILAGGGIDAVPWLNDPTWAKFAVISVNVWLGIPFMMVALLGGLQSIPGELYEAAEMDGASPLAALPAHHDAGTAAGEHDRGAAVHDLDLQHVPGDLPAHPGRARRGHTDPRHPGLQVLVRDQPARLRAVLHLGRADPRAVDALRRCVPASAP
ncbi:hypothetical protein GCM10018987_38890 [Streptomyces cremeus]